jgi:hypothetical protein
MDCIIRITVRHLMVSANSALLVQTLLGIKLMLLNVQKQLCRATLG